MPAVESIKVGDPFVDETEMGSMVSKEQLERVTGFVERAEEAGSKVLTGGKPIEGKGFWYAPTVVTDVDQQSEIIQTEVFGPVVTVQRFEDEDQALEWANGVPTACRARCGRATWDGRTGWRASSSSGASGSTPTSR